nr:Chain P, HCMV pp65 fragment 495-503, variant T8V (NLVPMVAVV) [synthetic construct]
NLVPMVAVV